MVHRVPHDQFTDLESMDGLVGHGHDRTMNHLRGSAPLALRHTLPN